VIGGYGGSKTVEEVLATHILEKITCLIVSFQESIRKYSPLSLLKGLLSKYTHFSVIMQLKDKYQPQKTS
jgi:hypothetical protein